MTRRPPSATRTTRASVVILLTLLTGAAGLAGCRRSAPNEKALATPTVTLDHEKVPAGSVLEITYKFDVASDASFDRDYRVFAQVKDADGERIWDDDHVPPTPTSQWKPGQTVQYTRTVFVPIFPYIGDATLEIGFYATVDNKEKRLPLNGDHVGQHAYRVARMALEPQTENLYSVFKDGWNMAEASKDNSLVEWQWTKKEATLAFKNLKKDLTFYLDLDCPGSPSDSTQVQVILGEQTVDSFTVTPKDRLLRRMTLPAAHMGSEDMTELHIVTDKTFVPAQVTPGASRDTRVLGVRVFHAYVDGR